MEILIGNLCSLLAMATDSVSSAQKTAKGFLLVQCLSQVFYGLGALVLKGYSATVQNAIAILRNLAAIRGEIPKLFQWILIILAAGLGLLFNNRGLLGLLPVLSNLEYSLAVFRFRDNERALKLAFLISLLLYVIFNACIFNFVGMLTNSAVVIMTAAALIRDRNKTS